MADDNPTSEKKTLAERMKEALGFEKAHSNEEEISATKKLKLIDKIQEITEKAIKGNATPDDLDEARKLNGQLGGQYSNLISTIALAVEQVEALKTHQAVGQESSSKTHVDPEVSAVRDYLSTGEVGKSEKTLRKIESGESVEEEALVQTWECLHSKNSREKNEEHLEALEKKLLSIYKNALLEDKNELSDEDKIRVKEINEERKFLLKREHQDKGLRANFGEYDKTESKKIVKENKADFEQGLRDIFEDFKKVDRIVEREEEQCTRHLKANNQNKTKDPKVKKDRMSEVEKEMKANKQEINREMDSSVTKRLNEKDLKKKENITKTTSLEAEKDNKAANKLKNEEIRSSALEALKALKKKGPTSAKPNLTKSISNIRPDSTPSLNKGNPKDNSPTR